MRTDHRITAVELSGGKELTVRSALEGRWAIFWDALGLVWHYEPRHVPFYTPDFYVENFGYIEIKPSVELLGSESERKITRFCKENTKVKVYAFCGNRVSFEQVALFESDKIYRPTFTQLAKLLDRSADAINYAFKRTNGYKLSHWISVGKVMKFAADEIIPALREQLHR